MGFNNQPLLPESVSHVTLTGSIDIGTRRTVSGDRYVYVYNAGNSEIAKGRGAVLAGGATSYSATVSSVSRADQLLGVCKHATIATGAYGWLLEEGFCDVQMHADDSATTGSLLQLGADGAFVIAVSAVTANYANKCGKALEGIGSGAAGSAYVKAF